MPKTLLTDLLIKHLPPPPRGQVTYWDEGLPSFGLRISQGGTKTFTIMAGRNRERVKVGTYPTVTLSKARQEAKRLLAERTLNKHRPTTIAFGEAVTAFLADIEGEVRPRTYSEYKRLLKRHWEPSLRHEKLTDITAHAIQKKLTRLSNTPQEQAHALTSLKRFFSWAMSRHYLDRSPAVAMKKKKAGERDHVLTDEELVKVWKAATTYPHGHIVRLCILTGLRRGEAASLHWSDLEDEDAIIIPGERTKNKRSHTIPRTDLLNETLETVPNIHDTLLFPARGKDKTTWFNGWSKCKLSLDAEIAKQNDGKHIAPYVLHDLRRTVATQLASQSVPPHIVERLLNHKSGTISGVAAIYNRYDFFEETKAALELWHERLLQLVAR